MWQELLGALALVFVIEGILPFVSPAAMRRVMASMARMNDQSLRFAGLSSMLAGLVLLYLVK